MTALPSNLALVADDLARATLHDARRSRRRRRTVTYALVFALLALTCTAAIASGWLFGGETPVVRVVPSLGGSALPVTIAPGAVGASPQDVTKAVAQHRAQTATENSAPLGQATGEPRTLLTGLGAAKRALTSVATTTGGVCLTLTGFDPQCAATFAKDQYVLLVTRIVAGQSTVTYGVVRDSVTAVDAISAGGISVHAIVGNGGFYAELADGPPDHLVVHLADGSSHTVATSVCPPATPDCTP